jgi:ATP-dependent DNA helicase RecG
MEVFIQVLYDYLQVITDRSTMVTNRKIDHEQLMEILRQLRTENSDNQQYEVKTAAGGFPETAVETMSAFSNTPGGGILIFGVDENIGFAVVGVYDPKDCQQTLADYAKNGFSAPIDLTSGLVTIDDRNIVWAEILEADRTLKPVKIKKNKRAYVRQYDGDFALSEQEEQMFVAGRGKSHYDEDTVPHTNAEDLDSGLVSAFVANRKQKSTTLAKMSDADVLLRCGVVGHSGELTIAGLVSLGIYPQQHLPNYSIKTSVQRPSRQTGRVRATNVHSFDGPIPTMLHETVQWVIANSEELVLDLPDGSVRNVREYLPIVMRELIANSLIHRDLSPMSMIQNISLTIQDERLVLSNPGGLYGLHVDELGHTGSKTRNSRIADICQYVLAPDGANVIEKLGSGIPKVLGELEAFDMPQPRFIDGGIYFTVILESVLAKDDAGKVEGNAHESTRLILTALQGRSRSKAEMQQITGLTYGKTKYAVEKLLRERKIYKIGKDKSPNTVYALFLDE